MYDRILQRAMMVREQISEGELPNTGLCSACHFYDLPTEDQLEMFAAWPDFSGEFDYPVPAPLNFRRDPDCGNPVCEQAYDTWLFTTSGLYTGEYGMARLRLLDHCIGWLKARTC